MNHFIRWVILVVLIVAALLCYSAGSSNGMWGFFILGAVFELVFWLGLFAPHEQDLDN